MLVTMESNSGSATRAPSIMDSPTLARVERARIRLEAQALSGNNENQSLERRILDPKVSQQQSNRKIREKDEKTIICFGTIYLLFTFSFIIL